MNDPVHHPNHYCRGSIECVDAIRAGLTAEEFQGWCKGNVLKYIWRAGLKGPADVDLKKAKTNIDWLLDSLEKK